MKTFIDAFIIEYEEIQGRFQKEIQKFDEKTAFITASDCMNHAVWLIGHITWCEDYLITEIPYNKSFRKKEWDILFGDGSKKKIAENYPSFEKVREHYYNVHKNIHEFIPSINSNDLSEPNSIPHHYFKSRLSSILHFIEEISVHLGQLQYLRKILNAGLHSELYIEHEKK